MHLITPSQAYFANTNFQSTKLKFVAFVNQGETSLSKQLNIQSWAEITP